VAVDATTLVVAAVAVLALLAVLNGVRAFGTLSRFLRT
jgi:hypothetical protein